MSGAPVAAAAWPVGALAAGAPAAAGLAAGADGLETAAGVDAPVPGVAEGLATPVVAGAVAGSAGADNVAGSLGADKVAGSLGGEAVAGSAGADKVAGSLGAARLEGSPSAGADSSDPPLTVPGPVLVGGRAGTHAGSGDSAAVVPADSADTSEWASSMRLLTSCVASLPRAAASASAAMINSSVRQTIPDMPDSIAPSAAAQVFKQAAASTHCPATAAMRTKYATHAAEMVSANAPWP